jgi:formylglycine-generating enzyme required for sulfatase activity
MPRVSKEARALHPHRVEVAAFGMDETEVTVLAYEGCVAAGACSAAGDGWRCTTCGHLGRQPTKPVNCIDHDQAAAYCRFQHKRLPSEEEWEYAARGSSSRRYPWGNAPPDDSRLCWKRAEPCDVGSHPLGATPEGIQDLAGSVWEITESRFCLPDQSGCGSQDLVARGGPLEFAYDQNTRALAAFRVPVMRFERQSDLGFRCVR